MAKKSKCYSCKWAWKAQEGMMCCNYLTIFGHMRGCEPGDECTKYKRGQRIIQPPEGRGGSALSRWQKKNRDKYVEGKWDAAPK